MQSVELSTGQVPHGFGSPDAARPGKKSFWHTSHPGCAAEPVVSWYLHWSKTEKPGYHMPLGDAANLSRLRIKTYRPEPEQLETVMAPPCEVQSLLLYQPSAP